MDINLEKIELVKDRTGVTYKEAKKALENVDGSIVDAIIYLEEIQSKSSEKRQNIMQDAKSNKIDLESEKKKLTFILNSIIEDPAIPQEKKVALIIHSTSLICGVIAAQPIPFADVFVLTPIQLVMVTYLNKAIGNPYEKSKMNEILTSLLAIMGWGVLAQQLILGAYKTIVPFVAGITTIPLVYGATYALGTGAKILIEAKKNDIKIADDELKKIISQAKKEKGAISLTRIKSEIANLNENAKEFEYYKNNLQSVEEKLLDFGIYDITKSRDEIILNSNIGVAYQRRYELIDERLYSKYKNLTFSLQVKNILALLPPNILLGEVEKVIGQMNYDISKFSTSKPNENSKIREVSTDFGVIYVIIQGQIIYLQYIELNESIRSEICLIDYIDAMRVSQTNKLLKNDEIRKVLVNTFKEAKQEINIISPWANYTVMNSLKNHIRDAIERGVAIKIIYGIGNFNSSNQKDGDKRNTLTEKILMEYAKEFSSSNRFRIYKGNTHIKLLICDNKYYVQGSYNFLSFDGKYTEDVRSELALYSESGSEIQELKKLFSTDL